MPVSINALPPPYKRHNKLFGSATNLLDRFYLVRLVSSVSMRAFQPSPCAYWLLTRISMDTVAWGRSFSVETLRKLTCENVNPTLLRGPYCYDSVVRAFSFLQGCDLASRQPINPVAKAVVLNVPKLLTRALKLMDKLSLSNAEAEAESQTITRLLAKFKAERNLINRGLL